MSVPADNTSNFPSHQELVFTNSWRAKMPRKKKLQTSATDIFWDLIERHPALALEIAFSLGAVCTENLNPDIMVMKAAKDRA